MQTKSATFNVETAEDVINNSQNLDQNAEMRMYRKFSQFLQCSTNLAGILFNKKRNRLYDKLLNVLVVFNFFYFLKKLFSIVTINFPRTFHFDITCELILFFNLIKTSRKVLSKKGVKQIFLKVSITTICSAPRAQTESPIRLNQNFNDFDLLNDNTHYVYLNF